jgi:hypothetical protein
MIFCWRLGGRRRARVGETMSVTHLWGFQVYVCMIVCFLHVDTKAILFILRKMTWVF